MTANFTDIKIENELQRMEWTNHSGDIKEVLEDVDGAHAQRYNKPRTIQFIDHQQ